MDVRKCIYTGKNAESKDNVIPKKILEKEIHNWANKAPVNTEYKNDKQDRLPTELEMEANEIFHRLELAKLRVSYYEAKLLEIQGNISDLTKPISKKPKKIKISKKDKQIETAIIQKEVIEISDSIAEEVLNKRKDSLWD